MGEGGREGEGTETLPAPPSPEEGTMMSSGRGAWRGGWPFSAPINALGVFEHAASEYDGKYFGYLWSQMAAGDTCRQVFGANDTATGTRYHKTVLEPGALLDGADMLRAFFGRDPSDKLLSLLT